ncbi:MAG TPA: biopolymer transporter ExbD [Planctomycetota bacterium]|jgi:biopolymer transport protein ExbD|nr:biopolymer transporter ExbD [Planctomycetota bacterium]
MAGGGGEQGDNPVAINVVPMVDVIFCLCVFFMCSFKFKQLEGKFDSWLPKGKGVGPSPISDILEEIRVAIYWDPKTQTVTRRMRSNKITDDEQLKRLIGEAKADFVRLNKTDTPVIIDAESKVPWNEVVTVINLAKWNAIDKIEFALGAAPGPGQPK